MRDFTVHKLPYLKPFGNNLNHDAASNVYEVMKVLLLSVNLILPDGGCSASPLRFFAHNSGREKDNSTKIGEFS